MMIVNKVILTSGDMSADVISSPIYFGQMVMASIQARWSGAPTGTLGIQGSNDKPPDGNAEEFDGLYVVNWDYIFPERALFSIVADSGTAYWDISANPPKWVRVVYTAVSGAGSFDLIEYYCRGA